MENEKKMRCNVERVMFNETRRDRVKTGITFFKLNKSRIDIINGKINKRKVIGCTKKRIIRTIACSVRIIQVCVCLLWVC